MKIQCNICNKEEAVIFCPDDAAAVCSACDHRVHRANILSAKHLRFPLHFNNNHFPLCDICQERRAFLFCKQDRAILCCDCDLPIHSVNELTRNHDRFLLTGVKLSAVNAPPPLPSSSSFNSEPNSVSLPVLHSPSVGESSISNAPVAAEAMSSVSEYLIEGISGWNFDEFLDSSSAFCKLQSNDVDGDSIFPFVDNVVELEMSIDYISLEDWRIWSSIILLFCLEKFEARKLKAVATTVAVGGARETTRLRCQWFEFGQQDSNPHDLKFMD